MADLSITIQAGDTLTVYASTGQAPEPTAATDVPAPEAAPAAPDAAGGTPPDPAAAATEASATGDVVPASPVALDATGPNVQG